MIYAQLVRFLVPLMFTQVVQEFGGQFLNGGMARAPQATRILAAYGLAWGLTGFLTSSLSQISQVGLVLVESHRARLKIQYFVLGSGGLLGAVLLFLALSPMGVWVIDEVHGVGGELGRVVRQAILWLVPMPVLEGLVRLYSGLLLRVRRTEVLSYAITGSVGASISAVFLFLPLQFVQQQPIRLPILVTYVGLLVNLVVILWGYRRYVRAELAKETGDVELPYVLNFFWPLALVMAIQGLSRPLVNLFVSRGPNGAEAVAALAVVYTLAHMGYGWLNDMRSLPAAFAGTTNSLHAIRRFISGCGLLSFMAMAILFWTPLRSFILEELIGIESNLAELCRIPLVIFTFFPLVVAVRAYLHGVALKEHRTKTLAPSAPSRIGIIFGALVVLPWSGLHGATLGVAALLCGFVLETLVVWWRGQGREPAVK